MDITKEEDFKFPNKRRVGRSCLIFTNLVRGRLNSAAGVYKLTVSHSEDLLEKSRRTKLLPNIKVEILQHS